MLHFKSYVQHRDITEDATPGLLPTTSGAPGQPAPETDPKVLQAVQAAKQAMTANPMDPKAKKDLATAVDTLSKAQTLNMKMKAGKLVQEFDPSQKNIQKPQQPQAITNVQQQQGIY